MSQCLPKLFDVKKKTTEAYAKYSRSFRCFFCQFFEWKSLSKWLCNLLVEQTNFLIGIISFVNTRTLTSAKHRLNWLTEQTVLERVRENLPVLVLWLVCCVVCSLVIQCLLRSLTMLRYSSSLVERNLHGTLFIYDVSRWFVELILRALTHSHVNASHMHTSNFFAL